MQLPAEDRFFSEVGRASKTGTGILLVEPAGHVSDAEFEAELQAAAKHGFLRSNGPSLRRSHTAFLKKT
jgi:hypothetical protein